MKRTQFSVIGIFTVILIAIGLSFNQNDIAAQDDDSGLEPSPPAAILYSETIALTSATNGEDYVILIGLPPDYADSEEAYPVLYVLDAHWAFGTATEYARLLTQNASPNLPPLITVGVGYPIDEASGLYRDGRRRDYDSRAAEFLDFLGAELIPLIDSTYRTQPGERGITGHSSGGRLILRALAERSELFDRYIAVSPSELSGFGSIMNGDDDDFRAALAGRDVRLFLTAGSADGNKALIRVLHNSLESGNYEGLTVTRVIFEDETHFSVAPLGLTRGMRTVFGD